MCGISGLTSSNKINDHNIGYFKNLSNKYLYKRGPDYQDHYYNKENNTILFHSRLSIIDLSNKANQPAQFKSDKYIITYNGEIYNYREIKNKLIEKKIKFSSKSDTEVLLKSIEFYGIEKTLEIIDGMFAFAVFDIQEQKIILARDKLGQKPLYFLSQNNQFCFSSDIKVISDYFNNNTTISKNNLFLYLKLSYFPVNKTIFENIYKLKAGNYLVYDLKTFKFETHEYWGKKNVLKYILNPKKNISEDKLVLACKDILSKSTKHTLIADVKTGIYLSGGTDSSIVAAMASSLSHEPIDTYTVVFSEKDYDESKNVEQISKYLNIKSNFVEIKKDEIIKYLIGLPKIYTEPFADISQLPTLLLNKNVKNKVILTGDGGDELFSGYNRHKWLPRLFTLNKYVPLFLRTGIFRLYELINSDFLEKLISSFTIGEQYLVRDKFHKFMVAFAQKNKLNSYLSIITNEVNYVNFNSEKEYLKSFYNSFWKLNIADDHKIILSDTFNYLIDDILVKVDRSCMNYSIENRTPFLNNEVINFAFSIQQKYKIRNNTQKWILKKILEDYLPKELIYKPKRGFAVPLGEWMRKDLKDFFTDLINESLKIDFINHTVLKKYWYDHLEYKSNNQYILWPLFFYILWLKEIN